MAFSKMKNCKICGTEIAKNATVCPHCGGKNKKNDWWVGVIIIVVVLLVLTIYRSGKKKIQEDRIAASLDRTEYAQKVANELLTETTTPQKSYGLGEKAEMNNISCSLVSIFENAGNIINKADEGKMYVLCSFDIENNSNSTISVSTILDFNAYCDDYVCNESITALLGSESYQSLDGKVDAGKKLNGVLGYELPEEWEELEIRFKPAFWRKEVIYKVYHSQLQ